MSSAEKVAGSVPSFTFDGAVAIEARSFNFYYSKFQALNSVSMKIPRHQITALIGPSGCGKSTFLRAINRMHDLTPGARGEGELLLGQDNINTMPDLVELRKRVGMIFQQPTPFPMSIAENVAYGMKLEAQKIPKSEISDRVENALKEAALWNDVKDKLSQSGLALSGGQQQRLCIARAIAVRPEVVLMDEPCAALDPISTLQVEETMMELEKQYTIVIVTHNMQQAQRVADQTAFFSMNPETRYGYLVEYAPTGQLFTAPKSSITEEYVSGRFG